MSLKKVLEEELSRISLSLEEINKLEDISKNFILLLKKNGLSAFVGGSLAKKTILKSEDIQDIDIFVLFEFKEDIFKLEEVLRKIDLPGEIQKIHGSRDYFRIRVEKNIFLEVIPVVKISSPEKAENVTDVSLLHVNYVKSKLDKNPKLSDEIKLAKAFCMAQNFYGAESYIKGFSGYSLEILVIHFGSFIGFLKKIGNRRIIDPEKYFRNEREVMSEINASKLISPLILIDPTYKYRNILAGLGEETYLEFLRVSKEFLKKPSLDFFNSKKIDISFLKKYSKSKKARFVKIEIETNKSEGDVAGTKMKKFFDFFVKELTKNQQSVMKKEFEYSGSGQKSLGYLVVREKKEILIKGPSLKMIEAVKKFRESKGKLAFKKGKYWWFKQKVSIENIYDKIKKLEKEMYVKSKIEVV